MKDHAGYPAYANTHVEYFPLGEDKFEALMRELKAARHFIFMEYFIVERGYMWDSILKVLEEKVKEGVEVRVMYDGMCCLMLLPYHYPRVLEKRGIRCKMFSPIKPTLSTYQNNRDHRKIVVIDGHTAFTGGVNLADEYINRKVRFGHWKDTAIMLKGDAVQSFTMMFLQMWNVTERQPEDYGKYAVPKDYEHPQASDHSGFVLPYGDSPMDREQVGERVYLDILNQARSYVHIMTPYLILDDEMVNALSYAAKRGIDVKLIMPHIPDKSMPTCWPEPFIRAHKSRRENLRIHAGLCPRQVFVSDDERLWWAPLTWISAAFTCILNARPIFTAIRWSLTWSVILRRPLRNAVLSRWRTVKLQLDGKEAGTSHAPRCPFDGRRERKNRKICLWKNGIHPCIHRLFFCVFARISQNEHITVIEYKK